MREGHLCHHGRRSQLLFHLHRQAAPSRQRSSEVYSSVSDEYVPLWYFYRVGCFAHLHDVSAQRFRVSSPRRMVMCDADLFSYIQFHPLVYLLKLHIEMNMADLIGKVVRAGNNDPRNGGHDYSSRSRTTGASRAHGTRFGNTLASAHHRTHIELGEDDEYELREREKIDGIKKTVVTKIVHSGEQKQMDDSDSTVEDHNNDVAASEASSTKHLHQRKYSVV